MTSPFSELGTRADDDDRLSCVHPDAHLERQIRIGLVQLRDRVEDGEPAADCPFGIILMRHRRTESGHDRIADELLDRAATLFDLLSQARLVGTDARADVLGILALGGGREADEVAEEDRNDLAFLEDNSRLLLEGVTALAAELCRRRVPVAALRADRH
jgi:hypothetical protein